MRFVLSLLITLGIATTAAADSHTYAFQNRTSNYRLQFWVTNLSCISGWEKLEKVGGKSGDPIVAGDKVTVRSAHGMFSAEEGGGGNVNCKSPNQSAWETFTYEPSSFGPW